MSKHSGPGPVLRTTVSSRGVRISKRSCSPPVSMMRVCAYGSWRSAPEPLGTGAGPTKASFPWPASRSVDKIAFCAPFVWRVGFLFDPFSATFSGAEVWVVATGDFPCSPCPVLPRAPSPYSPTRHWTGSPVPGARRGGGCWSSACSPKPFRSDRISGVGGVFDPRTGFGV